MVQTLTKYLKWALIAAIVFAGVQFSFAYINRTQLKSIMDAEALDARRSKTDEEEVISRIYQRAAQNNVDLPEGAAIEIEGIGDKEADIVVYAAYTHEVNLFVLKVPLDMHIEARADAPDSY